MNSRWSPSQVSTLHRIEWAEVWAASLKAQGIKNARLLPRKSTTNVLKLLTASVYVIEYFNHVIIKEWNVFLWLLAGDKDVFLQALSVALYIIFSPPRKLVFHNFICIRPLLFCGGKSSSCSVSFTMNTGKQTECIFYDQDFQQLLNSTPIVCLRNWAGGLGDRENNVCSCQRTLLILKARFPSGHHLDYHHSPNLPCLSSVTYSITVSSTRSQTNHCSLWIKDCSCLEYLLWQNN